MRNRAVSTPAPMMQTHHTQAQSPLEATSEITWTCFLHKQHQTYWQHVWVSPSVCQWHCFNLSPPLNQTDKLSYCRLLICQPIICDSQKYHDLSLEGLGVGICQLICLITIIWNKCIFLLPLSVHLPSRHPLVILFYFISFPISASGRVSQMLTEYLKICFFFFASRLQLLSEPPRHMVWHFKSSVISLP